jgi:SAM-dependent methyltransferase
MDEQPQPPPPPSAPAELPEHVAVNRRLWNAHAPEWVEAGERNWAGEVRWGIWGIPEAQVGVLPADMSGMRAVELGCGTGYGSAWMARRGARVVGVDISSEQLATARRLDAQHGLGIDWVEASAEAVPRPAGSFDFALSEYGAAVWCDPYRWIPEARRLLRPGGRLVLLTNSVWTTLCSPPDGTLPVTRRLERSYFGLHRLDWRQAVDEPGGIEFSLPIGEWFRLFRQTGFVVEDFAELQAPPTATGTAFGITAEWARSFPSEMVWKARVPG